MATKRPVGRPTDLTPERQDKIVEFIAAGNYIDTSVKAAGIAVSTFYNWMDRGQTEKDRLTANPESDINPKERIYLEFLEAIEKAQAEAEARNVAIIQRAAVNGTWQASAWWLERTRAKKFARMEKTELTGAEGGAVRVDVSTEDLERKINKILEKREEA